jgi:predicted nucleotidyltransferase
MSGNYVQRGDVAITDKFSRAETAVRNGVDLVVELPVVYALSSAEMFARAGVMMLGALGCVEGISFGSECGDIELLKTACAASIESVRPEKLRPLLESGMTYPQAAAQIIASEKGPLIAEVFDSPNNTLAVEYLKALKTLGLEDKIEAVTVKRKGAAHDGGAASGRMASASLIRQMIEDDGDISGFVPEETLEVIEEYAENERLAYFDNLERPFLYRLRSSSPRKIADVPDVGQGLENRIYEAGTSALSLEEFLDTVKTKRYTMAKLRRILLNLFLGIKNTDLRIPPSYGRILAFNQKGTEILKASGEIKDNKFSIPFSTSLKELYDLKRPAVSRFVELTSVSSDLYGLASRSIRPCASDFTRKIEMI